MTYQNFVYLSEELKRKKAIQMKWGECEVSFQLDGKDDIWKVESSISNDPQVAEDMHVLAYRGVQKNSCIRYVDAGKKELFFVKDFQKTNRYTLFRQFMKKYLEEVKTWKITLDLSEVEE
ncbi:MAG: hypothetical protein ACOYK9_02880 [Chlamydiia bacterium]